MRFLCMIFHDEPDHNAISDAEWQAFLREGTARFEDLTTQGTALGGGALQPRRTAVTVRVRDGKPSFTDGPFVETKEHLAGYVLIEAPDIRAAAEIAATLPPGRLGAIEVRPLWEYDDMLARRVPT
jgi:hypothetical protein